MARFGSSFLVVFAMLLVLVQINQAVPTPEPTPKVCSGDVQGLVTQCAQYVLRNALPSKPSPGCCAVVKTVDIPCFCQKITKDIQNVVDMNKVFHVVSFCGRPLVRGTKCGGSIVP